MSATPPLAGALDAIEATLRRYIWRPSEWEYHALALWTLHTHAVDAFDWSPLLNITSPDGGYGKTRTLLVLKGLVRNGVYCEKITASAAKRLLETWHKAGQTVTLLLDQVRGGSYEWEDLFDIGVRRGASIISNIKAPNSADYQTCEYRVFSPKALGSLSGHEALSGTNDSRALSLAYREKGGSRVSEAYPYDGTAPVHVEELCKALTASMTPDVLATLRAHDTGLRPGRRNDTYRPLVTLGDVAGSPWAERARGLLRRHDGERRTTRYVQVLVDLMAIYPEQQFQDSYFVPSREAVRELCELEETSWQEQRLSTKGLASLLKEWGVKSDKDDKNTCRGYRLGTIRRAYQQQAEDGAA